ncbi:EamA family transporter [Aestuariivita sp.]|jgi:drug/metabolite transporter (DMT)-like permease|uniref:EamA family transporter n=1 Tax=Aestuariivita sp. TaxID=1872407 RepID=UPI002173FD50|nr:EamA family transporter [Aestuariivita sp.]MCE8009391.1 EamA family transporter [Aestuariivita sp.]
MSLWIPFTLAAASFQTVRFMLQKFLSMGPLTASGATFARFIYSAPLILIGLAVYMQGTGQALPEITARFWLHAIVGGLAQILATVCVVLLFQARNFAVGITFKKTEVILSVLVGLVVLGEGVSLAGFGAILLGVLGVLLLSKTPGLEGAWWRHLASRAVALGLASGLLFAVSAVSYRGATLQLGAEDPLLRAGVTLAAVVCWQVLVMALWLGLRDRAELLAVWRARRVALWVGLTSMAGSLCWFVAFALQTAAYVKALGQVELVLSLMASVLFFKETITRREIAGMGVLVLSILVLVLVI